MVEKNWHRYESSEEKIRNVDQWRSNFRNLYNNPDSPLEKVSFKFEYDIWVLRGSSDLIKVYGCIDRYVDDRKIEFECEDSSVEKLSKLIDGLKF